MGWRFVCAAICNVAGVMCAGIPVIFWFMHDQLTCLQVFKRMWSVYLVCAVSLFIAHIVEDET